MYDVGKEVGRVGEEQQPEACASPCEDRLAGVMDTVGSHCGKPCEEEIPEQEAEVDIAMPDHAADDEGHQEEQAYQEAGIVAEEGRHGWDSWRRWNGWRSWNGWNGWIALTGG